MITHYQTAAADHHPKTIPDQILVSVTKCGHSFILQLTRLDTTIVGSILSGHSSYVSN
jgi:hypothetical protein